ncbi:MAG TPA: flagellar assembly protein FliW [Polyangiaceae bacterium]
MKINSTRFGALDIDEQKIIRFPAGIIGFPEEKGFVLIHHGSSDAIAWLQSVRTPELALPVVGAHQFAPNYPDVSLAEAAEHAGLQGSPEDMTALVVLCATPGAPSTVNLAAPIIVNATTWTGTQAILDGTRFSTRELFVAPEKPGQAAAEAQP